MKNSSDLGDLLDLQNYSYPTKAVFGIIHETFNFAHDWSKRVTCPDMRQIKLANIGVLFPKFEDYACCEKY